MSNAAVAKKTLTHLKQVTQPRDKNGRFVPVTPAPKYKPFTADEKAQFQARIKNEKGNIWHICQADPQRIVEYCEKNKRDERNAAVRFARQAAVAWARKELQPTAPF